MPLSLPGSVGVREFETIVLKDVEEAFGELHRGEARGRCSCSGGRERREGRRLGALSLDGQVFDVGRLRRRGAPDRCAARRRPDRRGGRRVTAVVLTYGHNHHVTVARGLRGGTSALTWVAPADRSAWDAVPPRARRTGSGRGRRFAVSGGGAHPTSRWDQAPRGGY